MSTRRFFFVVVATVLILCSAVISVNLYVNPYGYYGDQQLGQAEVFNAHIAKYYHLKNKQLKPEAIVLGSSNSMRMLPETIDSLFGLKAFNYGVYQATVEDFYCVSKTLVNDLQIKPKLVIICIDDWNFMRYNLPRDMVFKGAQNRLCYKWQLSQHLPNFSWIILRWCQIKTALSLEQLQYSVSNLKYAWSKQLVQRDYIPLTQAFYENGVRKKYGNEEGVDVSDLAEQGKYEISEYIRKHHEDALKKNPKGILFQRNEDFRDFQPERLELLDKLVAFLEENNVKVVLNIMPVQPYYQQLLAKLSDYPSRIDYLTKHLNEIKSRHKNVLLVKDNHDVKNFGGLAEHFFDEIHPTSVNSNRMLISIKDQLKDHAF